MLQKFDPFTQRWIDDSPEYPIWQRQNSNPVHARTARSITKRERSGSFSICPEDDTSPVLLRLKIAVIRKFEDKGANMAIVSITELDELKKKYDSPAQQPQGPNKRRLADVISTKKSAPVAKTAPVAIPVAAPEKIGTMTFRKVRKEKR